MNSSKITLTIEAYNNNAKRYLAKFEDFPTYTKKIREFQNDYIPKGSTILDLGCGPGTSIKTILERDSSCQCTGIDLSTEFLQIAKKNYPDCTFIEEDLRDFVPDQKFIVVLASFCIVHLTHSETEELLTKISYSLKEHGHLYLSFMEGTTSGFETTIFSEQQIFFNYYSVDYIIEILAKNDMQVTTMNREEYREQDGTITTDVFVFAMKMNEKHNASHQHINTAF